MSGASTMTTNTGASTAARAWSYKFSVIWQWRELSPPRMRHPTPPSYVVRFHPRVHLVVLLDHAGQKIICHLLMLFHLFQQLIVIADRCHRCGVRTQGGQLRV